MAFDRAHAVQHLGAASAEAPDLEGVPGHELTRSPAAAAVGREAAREGLLLYQFEHRATLPLPTSWAAAGADLALPEWVDGVLPEPKYASFRHDLPIGSFHPGHRAKWSAHELCHALVGFAWHPGATPLFHATAGRLAELVPVVLWYFLDEVRLRRCPRHEGPLFRGLCAACESAAQAGAAPRNDARAERFLSQAQAFVEQELAAVARTRRLGQPCPHVWGSLDLCSDGLAYAQAHAPRLDSRGFTAWAERFATAGRGGWHTHLDDLAERSLEVVRAVCEGAELAPLGGSREQWVRQDLAARVLQAVGGDPDLAAPHWDRLQAGSPQELVEAYAVDAEARGWPHPADVFAVGYDWAGAGRGIDQLDEGLRSVVPVTMQLAEDAEVDLAEALAGDDPPARRALGLRLADWLMRQEEHVLAGLARYEAALRVARGDAAAGILGEGEGRRWAEGVVHWHGSFDPVAFAEAVEGGAVEAAPRDAGLGIGFEAPPEVPTRLAIGRDAAGDLVMAVVPIPPEALDDADEEVVAALQSLGLVVPARWST